MAPPPQDQPTWTRPTRRASAVFAAKVWILRARRGLRDLADGPLRLMKAEPIEGAQTVAESTTALWSDLDPAERAAQLGKVQNLRLACRALDGLVLPAGSEFSFWRQVGSPSRLRGYERGRMLQQGCMVSAVGGGLCQLSNSLYEVALQGGCEILERHAHSRVVPGSAAAAGRDATVAWNYVDLRFRPRQDLRLTARLDAERLTVELHGRELVMDAAPVLERALSQVAARSCASCDELDCFLREEAPAPAGRSLFLVDEAWPEVQDHVLANRGADDVLGLPLDGARWRLPRYAWRTDGFARTNDAAAETIARALAQRRAGRQGPRRRTAELNGARRVAARLGRLLTLDVTEVVVAQSYLPFLWREGALGGRRFSVLMSRLPMVELQARLDAHAAAHPERATLADFRAPAWLIEAEAEALAAADQIVTPHADIAAMFGARAERLSWRRPQIDRASVHHPRRIVFPGPTIARKGAHVVRAAALALDLEVMPLGAELEGPAFWRGVRLAPPGDWVGAAAMVQPAIIEDQPRRLLAALEAGMPVIATRACGLAPQNGLVLVPPDNPDALVSALTEVMAGEGAAEPAMAEASASRS
jgi:hypothetical protein